MFLIRDKVWRRFKPTTDLSNGRLFSEAIMRARREAVRAELVVFKERETCA